MKNNKLLREKKEIIAWLNQYDVKDYELIEDSVYGYVVNVNGNVDLHSEKLKYIAVKFSIVKGGFSCAYNQLTTLEGCPKEVRGGFYSHNNQLTTLEGIPKKIGGDFYCHNNQLKILELKNLPDIGDDIYISNSPSLGELQDIHDPQKLRNILQIKEENERLNNIIQSATINNKAFKI